MFLNCLLFVLLALAPPVIVLARRGFYPSGAFHSSGPGGFIAATLSENVTEGMGVGFDMGVPPPTGARID